MKLVSFPKPYLLFLGDPKAKADLKTAFGMRDWAGEDCLGQFSLGSDFGMGLRNMTPAQAKAAGAGSLIIGIAHGGGAIPPDWWPSLIEAAKAGLDIVSGMHTRLAAVPGLADAANEGGVNLHDIRYFDGNIPVGNGMKREGKRVLMVGTDVNIGKKYTALAIAREMQKRGMNADFRATGQTGIMIAGQGIPLDSVVADFISGAIEISAPDNVADHWDVIEGQGSIVHPSYAGVTLGLLHGAQPDALVLCHDPTRTHIRGASHLPLPSIDHAMDLYIRNGQATNPSVRFAGISLNTSAMEEAERQIVIADLKNKYGLPVFDPIKDGTREVVDALETWI